jgi:hypothetical protein
VTDGQSIEFSKNDLSLIEDMLDLMADRLVHYEGGGGEMDWSVEDWYDFWDMYARFRKAAKAAGRWRAR